MLRTAIRPLVVAAVVFLGAGPSFAQDDKPSPEEEAQARKHFERGEAHQRLEQWDQAKTEYLRAYQLMPHPIFVFNVAQVSRLKGDVIAAVEYYQRYLDMQSTGVEADFAREYIEKHRDEVERIKAEAARQRAENEARDENDTAEASEGAAPAPETTAALDAPPPAATPADTDAPARPGRGLRIGGLASGASGVVMFATGIGFGIRAKNIAGELEDLDMWSPDQDARYQDGEDAERNSIVLYSLGAAAVVAGGVLYFLGHRAGSAGGESLTVTPTINRDFGGVVASGRF